MSDIIQMIGVAVGNITALIALIATPLRGAEAAIWFAAISRKLTSWLDVQRRKLKGFIHEQ